MNSNCKKPQDYNLQYLITDQPQTYSAIPSLACFEVKKQVEKKCFRDHEKEKAKSRRKRNRSRRHRKSVNSYKDAKFSDDEQEPITATSQIPQKESAKGQIPKPQPKKLMTFNDLAYFPKGSILSLKTCNLDIPTKNFGKADFSVEILSQYQHKSLISQYFDPGFAVLSIKKDKKEAQIIQYLSQTTKKTYRYLVCWFEAVMPKDNCILRDIATEANEKQRIFGWHNDHIKLHIMSMRQFSLIQRFAAPSKFGSQAAASTLKGERVVMIMQYPQRNYEIKDLYHPFASISRKKEEFVPEIIEEPKVKEQNPQIVVKETKQITEINPVKKQWYEEVKVVYEGWEDVPDQQAQVLSSENVFLPVQAPNVCIPAAESYKKSSLPEHVERIRAHFGIQTFEAILSDEEEDEECQKIDLATELLNLIYERERKIPPSPVPMEKLQQNYGNPYQYYQPTAEPQWNFNNPLAPEYEMQGYHPYSQLNDYSNSYFQYANQPQEKAHNHINKNYWIPPPEGQYYMPQGQYPRPGEDYSSGYQY